MRAWDNHNSYLDNDGNLLHGKIRFCKKATTDNVAIYNRDGVALRNPAFTDMLGRTEYQVFIDSASDVTAYYYKYIGTGDMMTWQGEDYDPSRWSYQYSSDSMDPSKIVDLTATTAEGVATMTDLRAKDPETVPTVNGAKLLWLYGYYTAGDKSPVLYYWDSASLKNDDGGAVIMYNNTSGPGRWILASNDLHFDVRHFGVFPQSDKYSVDYSYTSQLANCGIYIDNCGLDAWFPDNNGALSYYLMDGSNTFSITGDIYCSDGVRFMCKTGTTGTAIACHELHKGTHYLFDSSVQTGTASLTADWVNMSWVGGNCTGNARVGWIIDTNEFHRNIANKEVRFETNCSSSLQLDNCAITSNKKITGGITIKNSLLKTEFFADNYDWSNLTSVNNDIRIVNCKDANVYVLLKNKQNEPDYGDLLGGYISDAQMLTGNVTLKNASGSITVSASGYTNLNLDGFEGTVTTPSEPSSTQPRLYAKNCDIIFAGGCDYAQLRLRRCSTAGNGVKVVGNALVDYCEMGSALMCHGDLTVKNSTVGGNITHTGAGTLNLVFTDNVLNALLNIGGTTPGTLVNAIITGNTSGVPNPIAIDRTNLDLVDSHHSYTYSGNSGTFLPDVTKPVTFTVGVRYYVSLGSPTPPRYREAYRTLQRPITGNFIKMWNSLTFFDNVQFFRIGTDRFHVLAKLVGWDGGFVDDPYVSYCDINVGAYHIDGMTWGVKPFWTDPSLSEDNLVSVFNTSFFRGVESHGIEDTPADYTEEISIVYENLDKHQ